MKTVHLETGRYLYGGGAQVLHLVGGLVARGHDAVLVAPEGGAIAAEARSRGLPVETLPFSGEGDVGFAFRFRRLLRRRAPDLAHLHSRRGADTLGWLGARLAGVPTVLSRRVDNPEPPWWARIKYRRYGRVVAISEGIRKVLLSEGVPAGQVVTVRSAVDPAAHAVECRDRAGFLERLRLPAGALVVGMAAQFIPRKGHAVLLEALPGVIRAVPETRVLLFGRGPEEEAVQRTVAAAGLGEHVHMLGFRDDLAELLPCLDLLVHPALMEGLGVTLLEAGAAGVPVVASRAGGIPETMVEGETGLLVPPGDAGALTRALVELLQDPERRQRMGEAARRFIERERSVDAMVEGNLAVYRQVLGRS